MSNDFWLGFGVGELFMLITIVLFFISHKRKISPYYLSKAIRKHIKENGWVRFDGTPLVGGSKVTGHSFGPPPGVIKPIPPPSPPKGRRPQ